MVLDDQQFRLRVGLLLNSFIVVLLGLLWLAQPFAPFP